MQNNNFNVGNFNHSGFQNQSSQQLQQQQQQQQQQLQSQQMNNNNNSNSNNNVGKDQRPTDDDDFGDFVQEGWTRLEEDDEDAELWEDTWDNEDISDAFAVKLREELISAQKKTSA